MKKKSLRSVDAQSEMTPDEVRRLEQLANRCAEAERAWLRMTAPPDGDDPWAKVEEQLLTHAAHDQDRRWKFFSK